MHTYVFVYAYEAWFQTSDFTDADVRCLISQIVLLFFLSYLSSFIPLNLMMLQMGTAIDGLAVTATNYGESQATDLEVGISIEIWSPYHLRVVIHDLWFMISGSADNYS